MLGSSGLPVFPIDVQSGRRIDVSRQGTTFRFDFDDSAILTGGAGGLFTVSTELGDATLKRGLGLVILASRDFVGAPRLQVDEAVAKPWLDVSGEPLARVRRGWLYRVTYDPALDAFRSDSPILFGNDDLAPAPSGTVKGNKGQGNADLTVDEARTLLDLDHVTNKSEAELATSGPIGEALAARATDADITAALEPVLTSLNTKASETYVNDRVATRAAQSYVDGRVLSLSNEIDLVEADVLSLKQQLASIQAGTSSGAIVAQTWAALNAIPPVANQRAESLEPGTATHIDPVTGATLTPNSGTFVGRTSAPAGWQRLGPTTAAAAAAQVGAALTATPLTSATAVQLVRKDPTTGTLELLSVEDSKAYIRDNSMLQLYPFPAAGLAVPDTPTLFKAADPQLHAAFFQIPDADVAIDMDGGQASFDGTCPIVYAGEKGTFDFLSAKTFSWVGRKPKFQPDVNPTFPVPAVVKYFRKVNEPPPTGISEGDRRVSYWPDQTINAGYRAAIVTELNKLADAPGNLLSKLTVILIPINSKANLAINLAKPTVKMKLIEGTAGITHVPYRTVRGGSDAVIDTNLLPADFGLTADGHFFGAQALAGTIDTSGRIGGNSGNYYLGPNATSTKAAFRAGTGQDLVDAAPGAWVAMNRTLAASFDIYVEDTLAQTISRTTGDLGPRSLYLLGVHSTNGIVQPSALSAQVIIHGFGLQTADSVSRVRAFAKNVIAAANAVPSGV